MFSVALINDMGIYMRISSWSVVCIFDGDMNKTKNCQTARGKVHCLDWHYNTTFTSPFPSSFAFGNTLSSLLQLRPRLMEVPNPSPRLFLNQAPTVTPSLALTLDFLLAPLRTAPCGTFVRALAPRAPSSTLLFSVGLAQTLTMPFLATVTMQSEKNPRLVNSVVSVVLTETG